MAQAGSPYKPKASQEVATLYPKNKSHRIYSSAGGHQVATVANQRPITGEATTLPVLNTKVMGTTTWMKVLLPGRPNGHTGWIKSSHTRTWAITWHIVISTEQRRAWIYNNGKQVRTWLVVVGAPGRVTPQGNFFVEENIDEGWSFPGGPYALATSARSTTYSEFDGGPGQVALHGMAGGLQAQPGTAQSHGCVRFENNEITWLAARIYPGTPVTIR